MNELAERLLHRIEARQRLDLPEGWSLLGGAIAMPPKLTAEEWIARQGSEQNEEIRPGHSALGV